MVALALLLALAPVPFSPFAPQDAYAVSDATTIDLADTNNNANYPGYWTANNAGSLTYRIHSDVTIIGNLAGPSLTLDIDPGVTVTWLANYEATAGGAFVGLEGDGTLIIAEGASVINTYNGAAINGQTGSYELIVRGEVGANTGAAIAASGTSATVTIEGDALVYSSSGSTSDGTISMGGANSTVVITENAVVEARATGAGGYGVSTNGTVIVSGNAQLRTFATQGRAINLIGNGTPKAIIEGGLVEATALGGIAISTASSGGGNNASVEVKGGTVWAAGYSTTTLSGNAIRVNGTNSTVTVTGGLIYCESTSTGTGADNSAIYLNGGTTGTAQSITVSGDAKIQAWGSGSAIGVSGANATVNVSGGQISAKQGLGIRTTNGGTTTAVTVDGGFVFSYGTGTPSGTNLNSTIWVTSGNLSITDDAVVVVWTPQEPSFNPTPITDEYLANTDDRLAYTLPGAEVFWDTEFIDLETFPLSGIRYEGASTGAGGFFDLTDRAFVLSCKIMVDPELVDFGAIPRPYTQPPAQTVTVYNIGTGPVSLVQPGAPLDYSVSDLLETLLLDFADATTFTVRPDAELGLGTYERNITVSGSNSDGIQVLGTPSADVEATFTVLPSEDCFIIEFTTEKQIGTTTITESTDPNEPSTITVVVSADADLKNLEITSILPSDYAYIDPDHQAGQPHDFSTPVTYVVTAEDGETTRTYIVYVIQEEPLALHLLTASANAGGSVTGTPSGIYAAGEPISVTAVPSSGYHFTGWTVDGVVIPGGNTANPASFDMPDNAVTITANFAPNDVPGDDPDDPGDDPADDPGDDPADDPDDPDDSDEILVPETGDVKGPWGYSVALLFLLGLAFISLSVEMRERTARRPRHLA